MIARRDRGTTAEGAAVTFLKRQGYRILACNYRTRLGEIDVIAEDGSTVVFVEIKMRANDQFGGAAAAITRAKQARLARLAEQYLAARRLHDRLCRFDAVLVTGEDPKTWRIELVAGAFEARLFLDHRARA